ncbi:MAG: antibiotic biosynthesis monooxygenase [Pseudomonadota bacterium]
MIRVVYRWQVPPENFDAFQSAWRSTTNHIHETVPGALGSFMMRSLASEAEVITIARWDSLEAWKAFWGQENPIQMVEMRTLGERISVEAFAEVEDHTRFM